MTNIAVDRSTIFEWKNILVISMLLFNSHVKLPEANIKSVSEIGKKVQNVTARVFKQHYVEATKRSSARRPQPYWYNEFQIF